MNTKECKKCVYYGGKRGRKVICLNDECYKGSKPDKKKGNKNGG